MSRVNPWQMDPFQAPSNPVDAIYNFNSNGDLYIEPNYNDIFFENNSDHLKSNEIPSLKDNFVFSKEFPCPPRLPSVYTQNAPSPSLLPKTSPKPTDSHPPYLNEFDRPHFNTSPKPTPFDPPRFNALHLSPSNAPYNPPLPFPSPMAKFNPLPAESDYLPSSLLSSNGRAILPEPLDEFYDKPNDIFDSEARKGEVQNGVIETIELPKGPIWNPLPLKTVNNSRLKNKNFGKVAINMDTNLSSSTDDLLKLAGEGHLNENELQSPHFEDSPPEFDHIRGHSRSIKMLDNAKKNRKELIAVEEDINNKIMGDPTDDVYELSKNFKNFAMASGKNQPDIQQNSPPSNNSSPAPPICRYFSSGFCSRGERCHFLHLAPPSPHSPSPVYYKTRFKNGRIPIPPSRYLNLSLPECTGEIADMCLDQHGCRFLQRQLETGGAEAGKIIFTEVISRMVELMSDPFGNYLCQKLIEYCGEMERLEIVREISTNLVSISKNMHGTRAVQKLVEHLSLPEEYELVRKSLKGSVVGLIQDLNGNHVIQKCLHKMEPNDNQFIYDAVAQHCVQVSTHRHGCCVMQRCIDHGTLDQKLQLVEEIRKTALTLVQDAFGNYVVQYALDLDIPTLPTELIKQLHGKLHYLAKQKFSSNVVEKCLKSGDSECVLRVLRELMGENPDPKVTPRPLLPPESEIIQQKLVDLLQDSYGNYVIQTCLSEGATKVSADYLRMANLLRPYVHQLRTAPYIKRIHNLLNLPTSEPSSTDSISDVSPLSSPNRSQRPNLSLNLNLSTGLNRNPVLYFQNPSNQFSPICSPSISPSSSSSISQSESRSQSPKTNNNLLSLSSPIVSEKPPTPNPTKRSVSSDLFAPNFLSVPNSYPSSSIPKPRR